MYKFFFAAGYCLIAWSGMLDTAVECLTLPQRIFTRLALGVAIALICHSRKSDAPIDHVAGLVAVGLVAAVSLLMKMYIQS